MRRRTSTCLVSNREQKIGLQTIQMARAWQNLPEVTVKATKVKMVMHGDTIVYNADAFNLAEGSMLDALIKEPARYKVDERRTDIRQRALRGEPACQRS